MARNDTNKAKRHQQGETTPTRRNDTNKNVDPELVHPLPLVSPWTGNLRVRNRRSAQCEFLGTEALWHRH